jgi:hypothetical protein
LSLHRSLPHRLLLLVRAACKADSAGAVSKATQVKEVNAFVYQEVLRGTSRSAQIPSKEFGIASFLVLRFIFCPILTVPWRCNILHGYCSHKPYRQHGCQALLSSQACLSWSSWCETTPWRQGFAMHVHGENARLLENFGSETGGCSWTRCQLRSPVRIWAMMTCCHIRTT